MKPFLRRYSYSSVRFIRLEGLWKSSYDSRSAAHFEYNYLWYNDGNSIQLFFVPKNSFTSRKVTHYDNIELIYEPGSYQSSYQLYLA